jgi:hypothetical protein
MENICILKRLRLRMAEGIEAAIRTLPAIKPLEYAALH